MTRALMDHPAVVFVVTLVLLWVASKVGAAFRKKSGEMGEEERDDFGMILAATLTLLGLIIGFTFSMSISRYDQRKNYEEEEANAIGTEYLRADLLPAENAAKVRGLLKNYLDERVKFYLTRNREELRSVNARTAELQTEMWNAVRGPAEGDHSALEALTVAGMNDVINRQGYTQAAWWNRIPFAAWGLMWAIAICCNVMIGFYVKPEPEKWKKLLALPLIVAVSFMLIADIDSPRGGIIRVAPQNLVSTGAGMK